MLRLKVEENEYQLRTGLNTLGRSEENDIIIGHPKVSANHLKIDVSDKAVCLTDLNSTNGTFVDGKRIQAKPIRLGENFAIATIPAVIEVSPQPATGPNRLELKNLIHAELLKTMRLNEVDLSKMADTELLERARKQTRIIAETLAGPSSLGHDIEQLVKEVLQDSLGFGPIEDLLNDPEITEIMVNNSDQIFIEKNGKIQLSGRKFSSDKQIMEIIERIVAPLGRRIDESSPMVDARLKDGSRVNAIIPPLSLKGPCLTIRKFSNRKLTPDDLVTFGSVTPSMLKFLEITVKSRKNIVISGGTGSGKTTLLNILSSFIPDDERIVTLEDSAELNLPQAHVVSLESRPPNIEGTGAVTIRDLVRNALRMRPDRIVIGECRGGEALDMLQAMNTGHDGSLTTAHANSPRDAVSRLETMALMSGTELPLRAVRDQVLSAVDIIVQQSRVGDGTRKITSIAEVVGLVNGEICLRDIFKFKQKGMGENGRVVGRFQPTGIIPEFINSLIEKGIEADLSLFNQDSADEC